MIVRYVEFLHAGLFFSENSYAKATNDGAPPSLPSGVFGYRYVEREEADGEAGRLVGEYRVCSPWTMFGVEESVERIRERVAAGEGRLRVLLCNMENNGIDRVCRTRFGQSISLSEGDTVVEPEHGG